MFWLAEDDCGAAQSAASRSLQSALEVDLRLRGLQLGAHAKHDGHSSGGVGRGRRVSAWAGFSPIGPRNIRNQLLATTRDEKQQAKHRIPQFFSSLLVRPPTDSKCNRGDEQIAHTSYGRCLACLVVHVFIVRCWLETDILDGNESFQ